MTITREQLREVFEILMHHLERCGVTEIEVDWDYYWDIPVEELYNPYSKPQELDLGQLSDDWQKLVDLVEGTSPPVGYAFTWFSAILRAIGEKRVD